MTKEEQELYDMVSDWWDYIIVSAPFKGRDACIIGLVDAIIEWKDQSKQHPVG